MIADNTQIIIHDLLREGVPVKDIADRTNTSVGTVYRYRNLPNKLDKGNYRRTDSSTPEDLEPYQEFIETETKRRKRKANELYVELQRQGYKGGLRHFNNYFYQQRAILLQPRREIKHYEPLPGQQGQVDFGHFGTITIDSIVKKVYLFTYILSWSRAIYLEFVVSQNQDTVQVCHIHAFEKLGIPRVIIYDNMKTVVNRLEKIPGVRGKKKPIYNQDFLRFARYCQFEADACSPYWPTGKAKIERTIGYVREHFVRCTPRMNLTIKELNYRLKQWVEEVQQREHGTTKEQPRDLWLQEKSQLSFPAGLSLYINEPLLKRKSSQFGVFNFEGVSYHLGQKYARTMIKIRKLKDHGLSLIEIYAYDRLIATVQVPGKKTRWVTVFDEINEEKPLLSTKIKKASSQERRSEKYDIYVKPSNLDAYSINVNNMEGAYYG